MNHNFTKSPISGSILLLFLAQTGCYSQGYYPSYGAGYEVGAPYSDGYPVQGYEPAYPNAYGQPGYPGDYGLGYGGQDYEGQGYDGQGYPGGADDDDEDYEESYEQNRLWQDNP